MKELTEWQQSNPFLVERGIDEPTWAALCNTVYPGANPDSVVMAIDYCKARNLDPMLKPVHLVGMSVKNAQTGNREWRDVAMPGVGLYRIQASRSGDYAGADEPEFGPTVTQTLGHVEVTYPEWCKYTVYKLIGDRVVGFSSKEYWLENYATAGKDNPAPNAMWKKRVFGQLAKCAEAQALRKAWPEIGQEPTAEEMEGKHYHSEREINPMQSIASSQSNTPEFYSQEDFDAKLPVWGKAIQAGKKTPQDVINTVNGGNKGKLTDEMIIKIQEFAIEEAA